MVRLTLNSSQRSHHRLFPHSGYLGLTPVVVKGSVSTRLEDDSTKPLLARSLTVAVRCYESRQARIGGQALTLLRAEYVQTLWESHEYAQVGDGEYPFRITIPVNSPGLSTTNFVEYKSFWRVEAVLAHAPMVGLGNKQAKSCEIALIRYDKPSKRPLHPYPSPSSSIPSQPSTSSTWRTLPSSKSRSPLLRYYIEPPTHPVGPQESLDLPISILPFDPSLRVHGATVSIERRIDFHDHPSHASTPLPTDSTTALLSPGFVDSAAGGVLSGNSNAKSIVYQLCVNEFPGEFLLDPRSGVLSRTLTVSVPSAKALSRWAQGSTRHTDLVSVRFAARLRLVVSSASSRGGATAPDTIELAETEVHVLPTSAAERGAALAKWAEAGSARRSSRIPDPSDAAGLPSPPPTPLMPELMRPSSGGSASPTKKKRESTTKIRRPHTSGGERERTSVSSTSAPYPTSSLSSAVHGVTRLVIPTSKSTPSPNSATAPPSSASSGRTCVREWEAELERIAAKSRRMSVGLPKFAFAFRRR